MSEEVLYQKKKKTSLYDELGNQLRTAEKNKELKWWGPWNEPVNTQKGQKIYNKMEGLARLSVDVKQQGTVVSADMLTKEAKQEFKTNYGLSRKELERMLGDMQEGRVGVSEGLAVKERSYELFASRKRSSFVQEETQEHREAFEELGELLREKRKAEKLESYQMAELTERERQEFRIRYNLSEKELKKMVLDLQTGAVQAQKYDHTPLETERRVQERLEQQKKNAEQTAKEMKLEEAERLRKAQIETLTKRAQELNQPKEDALRLKKAELELLKLRRETVQAKVQNLWEDTEKRKARRIYLETGMTKEGTSQTWLLAPYVDEAEKVLVDMGDPLAMETVIRYTKEIEENLLYYRENITAAMLSAMKDYKNLPEWLKQEQIAEWRKDWEKENIEQILRRQADKALLFPLKEENTAKMEAYAKRGERIDEMGLIHGINIAAIDCTQVRELFAMEQNAFETRAESLNEQIFQNMRSMRFIVSKGISSLNQSRVQRELEQNCSEVLLFGSPAQAAAVVSDYLQRGLSEEVRTSEKNVDAALDYFGEEVFIKAVKEHPEARLLDVPYCVWEKYLFVKLKQEQDLPAMKQVVDYVVTKVWGNRRWFYETYPKSKEYIKELPVEIWESIFQYCEDNILIDGFKKELPKHVDWLLQQHGYLRDENGKLQFGYAEVCDREAYIEEYEEQRTKQLELKDPDFSNQYLLWNQGFLRNQEFGKAFVRYEERMKENLESLLKQKAFQVEGVDLQKIEALEDLESLPYLEFSLFLNHLCQNVRKAFYRWEKLACYEADQIKGTLLPALLSGTLNEETFTESVETELEKLQKRETIPELRIQFMLESDQDMFHSAFVPAGSENSLLRENKAHFARADRAWQILRENGLEREALKACVVYRENPYNLSAAGYQEDNPAEPIKELLRKVEGKDKKEAEELAKALRRNSSENFMNELLLCGQQNRLMDKWLYPNAAAKLSAEYKDDAYGTQRSKKQKALIELGETAVNLNSLLRWMDEYEVPPEEQEHCRQIMLPVLMILSDKSISAEMKRARFGVTYTVDALTELQIYLEKKGFKAVSAEQPKRLQKQKEHLEKERSKSVAEQGKQRIPVTAEEKQKMSAQFRRREIQLSAYRGGIFKPILPHIFRNDVFWMSMLTLDAQGFADKLEELYQKMEVPLLLLKRRYSALGKDFYEQLCDLFAPAILYGEQKDRLYWMGYFDEFFDIYCKRQLNDFSIPNVLKEFQQDDPVRPYVTMILLTNPDGLALLRNKKRYKETIDTCREHIQDNKAELEKYLTTYFAQHHEQMQEQKEKDVFTKGFELYLEQDIIWKEQGAFQDVLSERMEKYEADRQAMQVQQIQTEENRKRHREVLADIQKHREAGLQADVEEQKLFRELREGLHHTGSPLLTALGVKMRPGEKQIQKAKEKLARRGELPEAVQNCLLERMLSDVKEEQLTEEEAWLKEAYRQIEAYINTLPAEERSRMPSIEREREELLLHMYIRQLQREKIEPLAPNDAETAYKVLRERRMYMLLLLNTRQQKVDIEQPELRRQNVNTEDNPILAMKRKMVTEAMSAGMYILNRKQFKDITRKQANYFAAAEFADKIIAGCIKTYTPNTEADAEPIPAEQQMPLRRALLDYFREDLKKTTDINTLHLQAKVDEMLREELYRRYLLSGVLMEDMNSETLLDTEKPMQNVADRSMLEAFLSQKVNQKFAEAYSSLTRIQRQVFALTVLLVKENSVLPSVKFIHSEEVEESRRGIIQKQLQDYVNGEAFHPEIDYETVTDSLRMSNGRVQTELFSEAMEQTKRYISEHSQKRKRDFALLKDTSFSIQQADRVLKRDTPYRAVNLHTTEELQKWIMAQDRAAEQSDEQIARAKERLQVLNDYQLNLLAAMLNDRTMLDTTTRRTEDGKQHEFVNMEKRDKFKTEFVKAPFVYHKMLKEAAKTLHSYQLRDDVPLSYGYLGKEDFAPQALERTTVLDWKLLDRALDFVDECYQ